MSDKVIVHLSDYQAKPVAGPTSDKPLETGGGGGDSTGMEARVAKLEAHMEHVRADTGTLKADTGTLKTNAATLLERVAHLPTKGFIVTSLLATLAVLSALTLFGPNLRKLIGIP